MSIKKNHIQGFLLFVLGLSFILIYFFTYYDKRVLSFNTNPQPQVQSVSNSFTKPVHIEIPTLSINLAIEESEIVNGIWKISDQYASHLNTSANPGEKGNIVVYAHNKKDLFYSLKNIKSDATIKIITEDNIVWNYRVVETTEVSPNNIEYVLPKDDETLTLYTCTGFADSKRFIVIAKPI